MNDPAAVIDGQIAAYRDRDLERFLSYYAADAIILDPDGNPVMTGLAQLRQQYGQSFQANPGLTIEIARRMTVGEYVVDEEHLSNLGDPAGPDTVTAVAIYRVTGGLISRVMLLR
jgi:hypothetical protein